MKQELCPRVSNCQQVKGAGGQSNRSIIPQTL